MNTFSPIDVRKNTQSIVGSVRGGKWEGYGGYGSVGTRDGSLRERVSVFI